MGIYVTHGSRVPKGAVRLTIELLTDLEVEGGFYLAEARVIEVNSYGGAFASQRPEEGQNVRLTIPGPAEGRRFKKGDKLILDALTPLEQQGELLQISML